MYKLCFLLFCLLTISCSLSQAPKKEIWKKLDNKNSEIKIINGNEAEVNAYPYHVGILSECSDFYCSGSLISETMVLTSATCGEILQNCSHGELYFGYNNVFSPATSKDQQVIPYKNVLIHEDFSTVYTTVSDIAIIELEHKVKLNNIVNTTKLDACDCDHSEETGLFTGWSDTDNLKPSNLTYSQNQIISYQDCRNINGILNSIIIETHICLDNETISNTGDSGSPLVVEGIQVGIGSFAKDPVSVFTRIARFESWIKDKCPDCKFEPSSSDKNQISWFVITILLVVMIFQN